MVSTNVPLPPVYVLQAAHADDLDPLVDVCIAAMRESLERVGRFDPFLSAPWVCTGRKTTLDNYYVRQADLPT